MVQLQDTYFQKQERILKKKFVGVDPSISRLRRFFWREPENIYLRNGYDISLFDELIKRQIKVPLIEFEMPQPSQLKRQVNEEYVKKLLRILEKNGEIRFLTEMDLNTFNSLIGGFLKTYSFRIIKGTVSNERINQSFSAKNHSATGNKIRLFIAKK